MDSNTCTVDLALNFPGEQPLHRRLNVDLRVAGFNPLPLDREILLDSRVAAHHQERLRRRAVDGILCQLLENLRPQLLELIQSRDTINGYTPEQWAEMHTPSPRKA